ncbi:MAG: FAD-binding protein [Victivallales bacterium]|nr:FAD-binding protein [Victivallales bacterium]
MSCNKYNKIDKDVLKRLKEIVGHQNLIFDNEEKLEPYSKDEVPDSKYSHMPEVVVKPSTSVEISSIVKLANKRKIPLTPRGAGSGLSGGAVPIYGGIVISLENMNKIIELDRKNMMITVEPGIVSNEINEYLREYNLFYAGYPMSMETCFIGGNVAENAGGGKAVKYGVTSRYVIGLEVVMPNGEIVEYGGKLLKDVTGYNMVQLMLASEGTLGIFTKIILKLLPLPKYQADILCLFDSTDNAVNSVHKIITGTGITPVSIEYMNKCALEIVFKYLNESIQLHNAEGTLLISFDGNSPDRIEEDYTAVCNFLEKQKGLLEIYVADNLSTSERVWKLRINLAEAVSVLSKHQAAEDLVVPPAAINKLSAFLNKLSAKYCLKVPCYGHAGDGNLHIRIVAPEDWGKNKWEELLPIIQDELYRYTYNLGGRLSGEHGIGHKRKKYIDYFLSESHLNVLKTIKKSLDPNNIMNPGKIFDI